MNTAVGVHVHSMAFDVKLHVPLWLDVCTSANVVFGGQNKFVVEHPLRFMVQDCRRVQLDNLVVFYSQVMPCALQMSHLHNKERERKKHNNPRRIRQRQNRQNEENLLLAM